MKKRNSYWLLVVSIIIGCSLEEPRQFDKADYIGKEYKTAFQFAKDHYTPLRAVEVDGVSPMVTMDVVCDRINVKLKAGIVVNAYQEGTCTPKERAYNIRHRQRDTGESGL